MPSWRSTLPWALAAVAAVGVPLVFRSDYLLGILVLYGVYGSINLMWTLVLGTAGLQSFATLAVVGVSVYASTYLSITFGLPWPAMLVAGAVFGVPTAIVLALPAIRLRGVSFALFTLGLVELCRTWILQDQTLGASKGLFGADSLIPRDLIGTVPGALIGYAGALALLVASLAVYWAVVGGRLGLLLRTARESEPFAEATGIDIARVRLAVFLISSVMLGLIGGFYASYYRGVSPDFFRFDTLLLLLAMIVVGGMNSAGGVLLGTGLLLAIDQAFREFGAIRLIAMGLLMLLITLYTSSGLAGVPDQIRRWIAEGEHEQQSRGAPPERG